MQEQLDIFWSHTYVCLITATYVCLTTIFCHTRLHCALDVENNATKASYLLIAPINFIYHLFIVSKLVPVFSGLYGAHTLSICSPNLTWDSGILQARCVGTQPSSEARQHIPYFRRSAPWRHHARVWCVVLPGTHAHRLCKDTGMHDVSVIYLTGCRTSQNLKNTY